MNNYYQKLEEIQLKESQKGKTQVSFCDEKLISIDYNLALSQGTIIECQFGYYHDGSGLVSYRRVSSAGELIIDKKRFVKVLSLKIIPNWKNFDIVLFVNNHLRDNYKVIYNKNVYLEKLLQHIPNAEAIDVTNFLEQKKELENTCRELINKGSIQIEDSEFNLNKESHLNCLLMVTQKTIDWLLMEEILLYSLPLYGQ
jgi:hypothetical protein